MAEKRSTIIYIMAIGLIIWGIFAFCWPLWMNFTNSSRYGYTPRIPGLHSIAAIIAGIFILKLKKLGWILAIIMFGGGFFRYFDMFSYGIFSVLRQPYAYENMILLTVCDILVRFFATSIFGLSVFYLTQPKVKERFK